MSIDYRMFAVQRLVCPNCGAAPGLKCTTEKGKATVTHTGRWMPISEAYAEGYIDGQDDLR